jgi:hypothetical protein
VTQQERKSRRTLIARRWTAYRIGRSQREIWKRRREAATLVDEGAGTSEDLLAELPDSLLG